MGRQPSLFSNYLIISEMVPAPTVLPPSRYGEAQALLHRNRRVQRNLQLNIVARHHHLGARRQLAEPVTSVVRK